jgi:hypothetical protein
LLTLLVEVYRKNPELVRDVEALGQDLRDFYSAVDAVSEGSAPSKWEEQASIYHAAVMSGSNERARRLRRAAAVSKVLQPHFPSLSATSSAGARGVRLRHQRRKQTQVPVTRPVADDPPGDKGIGNRSVTCENYLIEEGS